MKSKLKHLLLLATLIVPQLINSMSSNLNIRLISKNMAKCYYCQNSYSHADIIIEIHENHESKFYAHLSCAEQVCRENYFEEENPQACCLFLAIPVTACIMAQLLSNIIN